MIDKAKLSNKLLNNHDLDPADYDYLRSLTWSRTEMNLHEDALLRRMIIESGEMWRETRDRTQGNSQVVVCRHPDRAFYLRWIGNVEGNINGWGVQVQPLEMADACEFFAAFGSHYHYWIGVIFRADHPVRAYVKNGRSEGWTISIGASE